MSSHGANKHKKAEIGCYSGISVIHWTYTEIRIASAAAKKQQRRSNSAKATVPKQSQRRMRSVVKETGKRNVRKEKELRVKKENYWKYG